MVFVGNDITVGIGNCVLAPSIIGVGGNSLSILVNDSNYVALQVLDEVVYKGILL